MRIRVYAVMLALVGATVLSSCGKSDEACEDAFESAALAVDDVKSATFSCTSSFEHDGQNGRVVLSLGAEESALPAIEVVYQSFASSSDLRDAMIANVNFFLDGTETTDPQNILDESGLEIGDSPLISELRDYYDIHPAD